MTTDSPLRSRLCAALLDARRARDAETTASLRSVLSALENAEAVPVDSVPSAGALEEAPTGAGAADAPRRLLSDADERSVLDGEVAALREAERVYADIAPERAASARAAAEVISELR